MRAASLALRGALIAIGLAIPTLRGVPSAHGQSADMRIVTPSTIARPTLHPGGRFIAVVRGLGAPRGTYCLGLTSLHDRSGLPVSLGTLLPADDGLMMIRATVPDRVFPAEPPGPFLLFVGHCTAVAPDGIYSSEVVTIVPNAR